MTIWTPNERVGKPLIGFNHMHSMVCREGDETSMLVERNCRWLLTAAIEGRDVVALVSVCLQPTVVGVRDDDSALIIDAQSLKEQMERTRMIAAAPCFLSALARRTNHSMGSDSGSPLRERDSLQAKIDEQSQVGNASSHNRVPPSAKGRHSGSEGA